MKVARTVLRGPRRSNAPGLPDRDLRWAKTQQNTSGRLTDPEVTVDRLTARSYIATVAKHGHDTLAAIRDALTGNPWTPPAAVRTTVAGA